MGDQANLQPLPQVLLDTPRLISSFGQDQNGEIYLLDYENGGVIASIARRKRRGQRIASS